MVFHLGLKELEPTCKTCGAKIDYGITTRFDEVTQNMVCLRCGAPC